MIFSFDDVHAMHVDIYSKEPGKKQIILRLIIWSMGLLLAAQNLEPFEFNTRQSFANLFNNSQTFFITERNYVNSPKNSHYPHYTESVNKFSSLEEPAYFEKMIIYKANKGGKTISFRSWKNGCEIIDKNISSLQNAINKQYNP